MLFPHSPRLGDGAGELESESLTAIRLALVVALRVLMPFRESMVKRGFSRDWILVTVVELAGWPVDVEIVAGVHVAVALNGAVLTGPLKFPALVDRERFFEWFPMSLLVRGTLKRSIERRQIFTDDLSELRAVAA